MVVPFVPLSVLCFGLQTQILLHLMEAQDMLNNTGDLISQPLDTLDAT